MTLGPHLGTGFIQFLGKDHVMQNLAGITKFILENIRVNCDVIGLKPESSEMTASNLLESIVIINQLLTYI